MDKDDVKLAISGWVTQHLQKSLQWEVTQEFNARTFRLDTVLRQHDTELEAETAFFLEDKSFPVHKPPSPPQNVWVKPKVSPGPKADTNQTKSTFMKGLPPLHPCQQGLVNHKPIQMKCNIFANISAILISDTSFWKQKLLRCK